VPENRVVTHSRAATWREHAAAYVDIWNQKDRVVGHGQINTTQAGKYVAFSLPEGDSISVYREAATYGR